MPDIICAFGFTIMILGILILKFGYNPWISQRYVNILGWTLFVTGLGGLIAFETIVFF